MSAYRCQDKGAKLIYKMKDNDKTLTDKVTDVIFVGKQTTKKTVTTRKGGKRKSKDFGKGKLCF